MQRADHARAVKVEDGIDTSVFNEGMLRLRTVRYTLLRISEIPRCRSLEFPRGRAVRRAWDELTGLSSTGLLSGQLGDGGGHPLATARRVASARARWDRIR
jgi:hypothetical protein